MDSHVVQEYLRGVGGPRNNTGPFYLVHPDLHGANIIIDPTTFTIKSILDWEGACILPIEDACALPRCLHNVFPDALLPNSDEWRTFNVRSKRYSQFFSGLAHSHRTEFAVDESITTKLFFSWAINDVRKLDSLSWQHLAPSVYPDLRRQYDRIYSRPASSPDDSDSITFESVITEFVSKLVVVNCLGNELDRDVDKKMKDLKEYSEEVTARKTG
jgi:hypothetical protein